MKVYPPLAAPGLTRRELLLRSGAAALGFGLGGWRLARAADPARKRVLFFSKSSDYVHEVIFRHGHARSYAERILEATGPDHGIDFTFSQDGGLFTPEYLAQFDAFCFFTSGDLLAAGHPRADGHGGDGNRPMTPAGKAAFLEAVRNGKGFVGIHSAADSFHAGETAATNTSQVRSWRYRNLGDRADPYTRMLGAEFIVHGIQQTATLRVVDPRFPGFEKLGGTITRKDEWYSLTDFSHDLHVLLVQDTSTMGGPEVRAISPSDDGWKPYLRPPYPSTWSRMHGRGRVFYTSMGHGDNGPGFGYDWDLPAFREVLYAGLAWAVRNVDADVTPNIEAVTPQAWTLPPISGPVGGLPKAPPAAPR
jgi:type 1 glutamine amidotransferase